jgi:AcrR family transcriptional regulator
MDTRQLRTRAQLRSAILGLAAREPVGTLSVAEVARAAGVTRDTFYRYAASPVELLAGVLDDEVRAIELPAQSGADEFEDALRLLLEHVATHAAVYRAALVDGADGRIRAVLHDVVAARLQEYLSTRPAALPPDVPDGLPRDTARAALVAFSAAGTVGAVTEWLRAGGHAADIPALARTVLAAGPAWWRTPVDGTA